MDPLAAARYGDLRRRLSGAGHALGAGLLDHVGFRGQRRATFALGAEAGAARYLLVEAMVKL